FQQLYPPEDYPKGHPYVAARLNNLGFLYQSEGEYGKAAEFYQKALRMQQQLTEAFTDGAAEAEALTYLTSLPLMRDALLTVTRQLPAPAPNVYRILWPSRALVTRLSERRHTDLRGATDPQTKDLAEKLTSVRQRLLHRLLHPLKDREQSAAE